MSSLADAIRPALGKAYFSTSDLPGIGGVFKQTPDDFCVDEVMPYVPCGEGEHVYITLRRSGQTTPDVGKRLAKLFNVPMRDVGWGGMKDKHAVTTQTFSLPLGWHTELDMVRDQLTQEPAFDVLNVNKHTNKIKRGHVKMNLFKICVREPEPDALEKATAIARALESRGVPNYFGEQRFSRDFKNLDQACDIYAGQAVRGRKDTFMVSVLQGALFNIWLNRRFENKAYTSLISGDVAQKCDTGGLFDVVDVDVEQERFSRQEIVYTGPIFGYSMRFPVDRAAVQEQAVLDDFGVSPEAFKNLKAAGTRRPGIIYPSQCTVAEDAEGITLTFGLQSGSYATSVLREFMKPS